MVEEKPPEPVPPKSPSQAGEEGQEVMETPPPPPPPPVVMKCNCEEKYERKLSDARTEMENEFEEAKQKALKELSDRVSMY